MDKISIRTLCPQGKTEQLSVNNIYDTDNKVHQEKVNFSVDELIKLREKRRKRIFVEYGKQYNICLEKITLGNKIGLTEIVYEVPKYVYGHYEYDYVECLKYIGKKLTKEKLDVLYIDDSQILISWHNIEKKVRK